jgi:hypothetical protein
LRRPSGARKARKTEARKAMKTEGLSEARKTGARKTKARKALFAREARNPSFFFSVSFFGFKKADAFGPYGPSGLLLLKKHKIKTKK